MSEGYNKHVNSHASLRTCFFDACLPTPMPTATSHNGPIVGLVPRIGSCHDGHVARHVGSCGMCSMLISVGTRGS